MTFTAIATAVVVVLGVLLMTLMAVAPTLLRMEAEHEETADVIHLDSRRRRSTATRAA